MIFTETKLPGAFTIEPERIIDDRGFFGRTWCKRDFECRGLNPDLVQCNLSFNARAGTLRGMHYQAAPFQEVRLVRCTMGAIYDVIVDLRTESETYLDWISVELSAMNRRLLYVPEGFAHGFLTLQDDTEVFYQMSEYYAPQYARGIRWNDCAFDIRWPIEVSIISERDRHYPDFISEKEVQH